MAGIKLFCQWMEADISGLSRNEIVLLEADLFTRLCTELKEVFREQYHEYFRFMKFSKNKEDDMLEANFVRFIIEDTLSTGDYNMLGVAQYTNTHQDVIQEVIDGRNINPSATLLRRSIDLHRTVRRELYNSIVKKLLLKI